MDMTKVVNISKQFTYQLHGKMTIIEVTVQFDLYHNIVVGIDNVEVYVCAVVNTDKGSEGLPPFGHVDITPLVNDYFPGFVDDIKMYDWKQEHYDQIPLAPFERESIVDESTAAA